MILRVLTAPDPRLRKISDPILEVTDEIRSLMDDMAQTMYAENGIGLAAPQVGVLKRVIVIDLDRGEARDTPAQIYKMANPEILWKSNECIQFEEGCLSVPQYRAQVFRPNSIQIRYLNEWNASCTLEATELMAICIQHEIDHLNGVLFIDHLTSIRKDMIVKKLEKKKRLELSKSKEIG